MPTAPTSAAFDDFLFAVIREETNGTPLSVISAFSRLGLEPWQEAARLAALPAAAAAEALTIMLRRLPQTAAPSDAAEGGRLVASLIELLPKPRILSASEPSPGQVRGPSGLMRVVPGLLREVQDPRRILWLLCTVLAATMILMWALEPSTPDDLSPPPGSSSTLR
jgi:hypothetical protein